jgi:hypothetical protein
MVKMTPTKIAEIQKKKEAQQSKPERLLKPKKISPSERKNTKLRTPSQADPRQNKITSEKRTSATEGSFKNGGPVCKLATKGKGRAYGKNS